MKTGRLLLSVTVGVIARVDVVATVVRGRAVDVSLRVIRRSWHSSTNNPSPLSHQATSPTNPSTTCLPDKTKNQNPREERQ